MQTYPGADCLRLLARELAGRRDSVMSTSADMPRALERRLGSGRRDANQLARVIAAHDFRRRGWAAVGDRAGKPLRSVAAIKRDMSLDLRFADGSVRARAEDINYHEEAHHE